MTPEHKCPVCKHPMRYESGGTGYDDLRLPASFHCENCGTIVPVKALKERQT